MQCYTGFKMNEAFLLRVWAFSDTSSPLQLLAFHTAFAKGADVDKPRNFAKSVTVK
jgi:hypothetical protein